MKHFSATGIVFVLSSVLTACGGGGGGGTPMPAPVTVVSTSVTWGADNRTKTTTTKLSDGTSTSTAVDVPPVESGGVLTTAGGLNSTSPLINTFGNNVVETLQDGSAAKPFQQALLAGRSNSDPNATVATATQTLNLSWGTKAAAYTMPTTDEVRFRATSTLGYFVFSGLYGGKGTSFPYAYDETARLGTGTSTLQGVWINADVRAAWAQGWTGAGVKIGVIDDFTLDSRTDDIFKVSLPTGCRTESGVVLCSDASSAALWMTHGEQVSLIAGRSLNTLRGYASESGIYSTPTDFGRYGVAVDLTVTLSAPLYGVAKDAQVYRNDFLTYQAATQGLFSELKRWGEGTDASSALYRQLKVVNLSLGGTSKNTVVNTALYSKQMEYANASTVPDAVFVKAAGNSACVVSRTNCDPLNAVFYNSSRYKDKSLLVGALDQEGGSIASYSNQAGSYAERFVVADGRGLQDADGNYAQGTSFAAPRVAGYVAIVRQKFPNLSAANTASVILDTALWNAKWGDKSAANMAVYGQGEASLGRALAPVGRLR